MDLISLARDAWRHKFVTVPIAVITFVLALWVLVIKPHTYVADTSYTLVSPPPPPTQAQITADPSLAKVNTNNPYISYGDLTAVVDLLSQTMAGPAVKQRLEAEGVPGSYTVEASPDASAPIIDIAGTGSSPAAASTAASRIASLTLQTLNNLQVQQHVVARYRVTAQQLVAPDHPTAKLSSEVRDLIAILAIGLIAWFIVLSIVKGIAEQLPGAVVRPGIPRRRNGHEAAIVREPRTGAPGSAPTHGNAPTRPMSPR